MLVKDTKKTKGLFFIGDQIQILVKDQLISKCSFWCHDLDQNTNENFSSISALASKKRSNQKKIKAIYFTN